MALPHHTARCGAEARDERRKAHQGRRGAPAGGELDTITPLPGRRPSLVANLLVPVAILLSIAVGSFFAMAR
jgi:hypothetical protein